jgi:hypothetical protein
MGKCGHLKRGRCRLRFRACSNGRGGGGFLLFAGCCVRRLACVW